MNMLKSLTPKCDVKVLYSDYTIRQGLEVLRRSGYSALPVITRDGDYAGSVSEGDFLWQYATREAEQIRALGSRSLKTLIRRDFNQPVKVSASLEDLVERIINQNFVPIVDDREKFIGIITRKEIIKAMVSRLREAMQQSSGAEKNV